MNDADRKAAEQQYSITAFDYASNPIGSRDWILYLNGFQAACEWRDSQVGEPTLWMTEWWVEGGPDEGEYEYETNHINEFSCGRKDGFPLYRHPPTAQINQQLVEALEKITEVNEDTPVKTYQEMERIAQTALAATQMRGDA